MWYIHHVIVQQCQTSHNNNNHYHLPLWLMTWFLLFQHQLNPHHTIISLDILHIPVLSMTPVRPGQSIKLRQWVQKSNSKIDWVNHYHGTSAIPAKLDPEAEIIFIYCEKTPESATFEPLSGLY